MARSRRKSSSRPPARPLQCKLCLNLVFVIIGDRKEAGSDEVSKKKATPMIGKMPGYRASKKHHLTIDRESPTDKVKSKGILTNDR